MNILVLGAGISGLAAAWSLKKQVGKEARITILEQQNRPGGCIQTVEYQDFLFELGPHSIRSAPEARATFELIRELGLMGEVIEADPASRNRYLWGNNRLNPLPGNLLGAAFSPYRKLFLKAIWNDWRAQAGDDDESIHAFAERHFGRECAEELVDPMVLGIYAGDSRFLSVKSCFPKLKEREVLGNGSVIRGMFRKKNPRAPLPVKAPFTFRGGMETLPKTLAGRLEEELQLGVQVDRVRFFPEGVEVMDSRGNTREGDFLVSTLPFLPQLPLPAIPAASVTVVNLGYCSDLLKKKGFGYLIPSKEKERMLGVIWDSSVFPQQNRRKGETRLTVMIPGDVGEEEAKQIALEGVGRHLGIDREPDAWKASCAKESIPQYPVGYSHALEEMERKLHPRLRVLGSAFCGVSVNDCISSGTCKKWDFPTTIKLGI